MVAGPEAHGRIITVGMGEMKVAQPPMILAALGIGSCVAVIVRDSENGAGGMAHVMLPRIPKKRKEGSNLYKYADYAISRMIEEVLKVGGAKKRLGAKLVGGAHMFQGNEGAMLMDIGGRNVEAVRRALDLCGLPILGEDTGGNQGRSVELCLEDGRVRVSSLRKGTIAI